MQSLGLTLVGHQIDAKIAREVLHIPELKPCYVEITEFARDYISVAKHIHKLRYRRPYMLEITCGYVKQKLQALFNNIESQKASFKTENSMQIHRLMDNFMEDVYAPNFMPTSKRYMCEMEQMPIGYIKYWNDTESNILNNNYKTKKYELISELNTITMRNLSPAGKNMYDSILPSKIQCEKDRMKIVNFINSYIALFASLTHLNIARKTKFHNNIMAIIRDIILTDYHEKKTQYKCFEDETVNTYSNNIIVTASKYIYSPYFDESQQLMQIED